MASTRKRRISKASGVRRQLDTLLSERENLREEIRQLRASIQIYAEIVRRLERWQRAA